jgi:dTDP-4-dehydrorhamnose reductase
MRILLLGGNGQVGKEFATLPLPKDVFVEAPSRAVLNLQDFNAIAHTIATGPWDVVINAAAYTHVDRAETEETTALAINGTAPAQLAAETGRRGIPFIHISSDYVFDGRKGTPYVETDPTAPLNAYGRTKLAGELGVRANNPKHVILRSSWVFSAYRTNFLRTIVRLATERDRLTIVADQRGCPTAARDLARACLTIALKFGTEANSPEYGTYHLAGAGETNWFEFATAIVDVAGDRLGRKPLILPISTAEYPTPAVRPTDSRLDCSIIARTLGIEQQSWRAALPGIIDQVLLDKGKP